MLENAESVIEQAKTNFIEKGIRNCDEGVIQELLNNAELAPYLSQIVTAKSNGSVPAVNVGVAPKNSDAIKPLINEIYSKLVEQYPNDKDIVIALDNTQLLILAAYYGDKELVEKISAVPEVNLNIAGDRDVTAACIAITCASSPELAESLLIKGGRLHGISANKDDIQINQGVTLPHMTSTNLVSLLGFEKKFGAFIVDCEYYNTFKKVAFCAPEILTTELQNNPEQRKQYVEFVQRAAKRSQGEWLFSLLIEPNAGIRVNLLDDLLSYNDKLLPLSFDESLHSEITAISDNTIKAIQENYELLKGVNPKIIGELGVDGVSDLLKNLKQAGELARNNPRFGNNLENIMSSADSPPVLQALYEAAIKPHVEAGRQQTGLLAMLKQFWVDSIQPLFQGKEATTKKYNDCVANILELTQQPELAAKADIAPMPQNGQVLLHKGVEYPIPETPTRALPPTPKKNEPLAQEMQDEFFKIPAPNRPLPQISQSAAKRLEEEKANKNPTLSP